MTAECVQISCHELRTLKSEFRKRLRASWQETTTLLHHLGSGRPLEVQHQMQEVPTSTASFVSASRSNVKTKRTIRQLVGCSFGKMNQHASDWMF
jgi:hypothetical protein